MFPGLTASTASLGGRGNASKANLPGFVNGEIPPPTQDDLSMNADYAYLWANTGNVPRGDQEETIRAWIRRAVHYQKMCETLQGMLSRQEAQ